VAIVEKRKVAAIPFTKPSILVSRTRQACHRSYNPPDQLWALRAQRLGWRIVSPLAALVVSVRLGSSHHIFCRQPGPSAPAAVKRCGTPTRVSAHDFTLLKKKERPLGCEVMVQLFTQLGATRLPFRARILKLTKNATRLTRLADKFGNLECVSG
jgi:hypothetical protein